MQILLKLSPKNQKVKLYEDFTHETIYFSLSIFHEIRPNFAGVYLTKVVQSRKYLNFVKSIS